jgi:hypothetical protein
MPIRVRRRVYPFADYATLFFGGPTAYNAVSRGKSPIPRVPRADRGRSGPSAALLRFRSCGVVAQ